MNSPETACQPLSPAEGLDAWRLSRLYRLLAILVPQSFSIKHGADDRVADGVVIHHQEEACANGHKDQQFHEARVGPVTSPAFMHRGGALDPPPITHPSPKLQDTHPAQTYQFDSSIIDN